MRTSELNLIFGFLSRTRHLFSKKALSSTIFHNFELFYDFLEGFYNNIQYLFSRTLTLHAHNFGILNFAHFPELARNCAKIRTHMKIIVPIRYISGMQIIIALVICHLIVSRNLLKDYKYTQDTQSMFTTAKMQSKIHTCVFSQMFCSSRSNLMFTYQLKIPKKWSIDN